MLAGIAERWPAPPRLTRHCSSGRWPWPAPSPATARSRALAGIAVRAGRCRPAWAAALIEQALAVAEAIPDGRERSRALAGIAERLAVRPAARR